MGLRERDIKHGEGPHWFRRREMRPRLDRVRQTLVDWRYAVWEESAIQHKVEAREVDGQRFIRMRPPCVLHGVSIHCELMDLGEEQRIGVFRFHHFREHTPALRRRIEIPVRCGSRGLGHDQAASGADSFVCRRSIHLRALSRNYGRFSLTLKVTMGPPFGPFSSVRRT